tara:strand:+ start:1531 stop:1653 length:123 start_codon:yes stop_codon:yes gene_type:complete
MAEQYQSASIAKNPKRHQKCHLALFAAIAPIQGRKNTKPS